MVSFTSAGDTEFWDGEKLVHHKYADSQVDGGSTWFQLRESHQVNQEQPPQSLDSYVLSVIEAVHDKDGKTVLRVLSITRSTYAQVLSSQAQ